MKVSLEINQTVLLCKPNLKQEFGIKSFINKIFHSQNIASKCTACNCTESLIQSVKNSFLANV